jgi:hypothetical protein
LILPPQEPIFPRHRDRGQPWGDHKTDRPDPVPERGRTLPQTVEEIPRQVEGIDQVEILVIDDRQVAKRKHFSVLKRMLQRFGSATV